MTGEDLATLRKSLHMTQEVFAKRIGIDRAHLARVEANKGGIISDTMALRVNSIFSHTPKTDSEWLIDFYDFDVTAMPKDFFSDSSIKPTTKLDLPGFAGATFAINVAGHAMAPSIEPGSMIIVKEVTDKDIILYGEVYLLITED